MTSHRRARSIVAGVPRCDATRGRSYPLLVRSITLRALPAACASLALVACGGASARTAATPRAVAANPVADAACGAATQAAVAGATLQAARRIYGLELESVEVREDRRQVENYGPLLTAVAAGNQAAVQEAVTALVYSHTHIVRLRVTRHGSLLADVGGPYILAPVTGVLRLHGRVLGGYGFSVQDDLGYVKLEQRYVGAPLILRREGRRVPLEGTIADAGIAHAGLVRYAGSTYFAKSFGARAYPSGALRVTLLSAAVGPSRKACVAVRADALAAIGKRIWTRFIFVGASPSSFATAIGGLTGALAYVLRGPHLLAGSTRRPPAGLGHAGTLRFHGLTYSVRSFTATVAGASVRVFQLIP